MREITLDKNQLKITVGDKVIELDGKDCSEIIKTIIESSLELWVFEIEVNTYKREKYIDIEVELVGFVDYLGYADSHKEFFLRVGIDECREYKLDKVIKFVKELDSWIKQVRKNKKTVKYEYPLYDDMYDDEFRKFKGDFKLEVELTLHYEKYGDGLYDTMVHKYYLKIMLNGKKIENDAMLIVKEALKNIEPYRIKHFEFFPNDICPVIIAPDGKEKELYASETGQRKFVPCDTWNVETWEKEAYRYFKTVASCIKDAFFWIEAKERKEYLDAWD